MDIAEVVSQLVVAVEDLKEENKLLKSKISNLAKKSKEKDKKIQDLEQGLCEVEEEAGDKVRAWKNQFEKHREHDNKYRDQALVPFINKFIAEHNQRLKKLESSNQELEQGLCEVEEEADDKVSALRNEFEKHREHNNKYDQRLKKLEVLESYVEQKLKPWLEEKFTGIFDRLRALENKVPALQKSISELEDNLSDLDRRVDDVDNESNNNNNNDELVSEIQRLRQDLHASTEVKMEGMGRLYRMFKSNGY